MLIFAIDTSGETASAALVTEGKVLAETNFAFGAVRANYANIARITHSETLMPMIDFMLGTSRIPLSDIDYIAFGAGPGSFTGLRIGAATAKALCHAAGKRLIPIPTLDALAYNVCGYPFVVPVMDARRGQVYACRYANDGALTRLAPYAAEDLDAVLGAAAAHEKKTVFTGDAAGVFYDRITAYSDMFCVAPEHLRLQRAASVGLLALTRTDEATDYGANPIMYLRKPQAERVADGD